MYSWNLLYIFREVCGSISYALSVRHGEMFVRHGELSEHYQVLYQTSPLPADG
jgi:hypothetical protein